MECCMIVPLSLLITFVHSGCWPVVKYCSVSMIISLELSTAL